MATVAWISNQRLKKLGWATPFLHAPELCVQIMSPSDSWAEMHMKAGFYLAAGALEVWVIAPDGKRTVIKPDD